MRTLAPRSLPPRQMAPGLRVVISNAATLGHAIDPFLQCDAFRMSAPFFPPHPHAGFSAVTYMLPRSRGGFINRDSQGDRSEIRPGALHWTEAASGLLHEEVPKETGVTAEGLQIFVDLPTRHKLDRPAVYHVEPEDVPLLEGEGFTVRILAGTLFGIAARFQPRTACALWDVRLAPGSGISLPLPSGWNVGGLLLEGGTPDLAPSDDPLGLVPTGDGDEVRIEGGARGWHGVLMAGQPLNEPRAFGGPFVMASPEQLEDAKRRFGRGEMGHLDRSF